MSISNEDFIKLVFGEDGAVAIMSRARGKNGMYARTWPCTTPGINDNYLSYSTYETFNNNGQPAISRQHKYWKACYGFILDDIGTKCPEHIVDAVQPNVKIETSPGNFQYVYLFDDPVSDMDALKVLETAAIKAGLTDPGANDWAIRPARLPVGTNNKEQYGAGFQTVATALHMDRHSIDWYMKAFKLSADTKPEPSNIHFEKAPPDHTNMVVSRIKELGMWLDYRDGKHFITCPHSAHHTTKSSPTATYYQEPDDKFGLGSFKCSHGHCSDYRLSEFFEDLKIPKIEAAVTPKQPDPDGLNLDVHEKTGKLLNILHNYLEIFDKDSRTGFDLRYNALSAATEVNGKLLQDVDYTNACASVYRLYGVDPDRMKVTHAMESVAHKRSYNPLQDWLNGLKWDGRSRANRVFIDYLNAEDTDYIRQATRMWLLGAVHRAMEPGCKFDNAIVLWGPQGIGKSTILSMLANGYFRELETVDPKHAIEAIRGGWIVEFTEMNITSHHDAEAMKKFLSAREDQFRPAYGRNSIIYLRSYAFAGTSNKPGFLQSGDDRRFWPIETRLPAKTFMDHKKLEKNLDQIWAEMAHAYKKGEKPLIPDRLQEEVVNIQTASLVSMDDPWRGPIEAYLNSPCGRGYHPIEAICRPDLWRLLPPDQRGPVMDLRASNRIGVIMKTIPGWTPVVKRYGVNGVQRGWICEGTEGRYIEIM